MHNTLIHSITQQMNPRTTIEGGQSSLPIHPSHVWVGRISAQSLDVCQPDKSEGWQRAQEPPVATRHLTTFPSPPLVHCVCFGLCPSLVSFYASVILNRIHLDDFHVFTLHALVSLLSSNCLLLSSQVSLCSFSACLWTHHAMPFQKNSRAY